MIIWWNQGKTTETEETLIFVVAMFLGHSEVIREEERGVFVR